MTPNPSPPLPKPPKQAHTKPERKAGSWLCHILRLVPKDAR